MSAELMWRTRKRSSLGALAAMSVLTWSRSNLHALIPHTAHITHPRAHTERQSTKHDPQPSVASAVRTRLSSGPAHTLQCLHTHLRSSHPHRVHRRHSSAQRAPQPPAACRLLHAFTRLMCTPYPSCLLHLPAPDRHAQNLKVVPAHSHSCRPPLPSAARRSLATPHLPPVLPEEKAMRPVAAMRTASSAYFECEM